VLYLVPADDGFQELFALGVKLIDISDEEVARALDVSLPTVARWKSGESTPHKVMRKCVFEWMDRRICG